ncbi:hypothetical protein CORC01_05657 [Colletotrichum orchidophilum]|uniref:Uncharacterized protein n=1 Tax=Colletotrichum orchidophilum TaxID=1209926 RepID=A0A1G4BC80_9PEZI|nr:uncharacterized protein CORC01_05657 [Colletotrichum orchidophilum]OHE98967.1 hypothetical protein CORC01_05657 [Colletotrichum orchidophilum]
MSEADRIGVAAVACAENISLLYLLGKRQHDPQPNRRTPEPTEERGRTLKFHRERSLCGAFAFLASIDGNPDFIPAVYIEERPDQRRLEIVVAVNKKSPMNGEEILEDIKRGFEEIFLQLQSLNGKYSSNKRSEIDDWVFEEVVEMCYERILNRIREEQPRVGGPRGRQTKKRKSMEELLETLDLYFTRPGNSTTQSQKFLARARDATKSLRKWRRYQNPSMLKPLVQDIFQLSRIGQFEKLIHMIPHREMDPGSKSSLCNMILKVARYREVSRHIYRTAKKYPIARCAKVVTVNLTTFSPGAYDRISDRGRYPELATALARNGVSNQPDQSLRDAWNISRPSLQDATVLFEKQAKYILQSAKVHAEVQLIYHYHLKERRSELPPRVIRSSKDACYLCNAFIEAEKTFYTSRCHGRLYPSWKLPSVGGRLDLAQRFNEQLKGRINSAYGDLTNFNDNYPKLSKTKKLTSEISLGAEETPHSFKKTKFPAHAMLQEQHMRTPELDLKTPADVSDIKSTGSTIRLGLEPHTPSSERPAVSRKELCPPKKR